MNLQGYLFFPRMLLAMWLNFNIKIYQKLINMTACQGSTGAEVDAFGNWFIKDL